MTENKQKIEIEQWGYTCGSEHEAAGLVWPVRFKPAATFVLVVLGLTFRWPALLIIVGTLGLLGTAVQSFSWIDRLYNHVVRHWFKALSLGPDPWLRRGLCGMADAFVLLSGLALVTGNIGLAWLFGGMVILLSGSVVLTGICLPAYLIYRWKKK